MYTNQGRIPTYKLACLPFSLISSYPVSGPMASRPVLVVNFLIALSINVEQAFWLHSANVLALNETDSCPSIF